MGNLKTRAVGVIVLYMAVFCMCGEMAQAVPVTIEISGVVTDGYGSLWGGDIYVGAGFNGTYIYDSSTINTSVLPYQGRYVHNSPYGIEVLLGGFEFRTESNHIGQFEILITNAVANYDSYKVISNENASFNGADIEYISWTLGGPPSTISSIALPVSEPMITDWPINVLEISGLDALGHEILIQGMVTQAMLIPEPATITLLLTMGVFLLRRKRQVFTVQSFHK